ncbi:MAG: CopG family transcriptional regulator [Magnetococcales bacterium]|nr:CopG family transcriptional regulator [Magnetococcales bacterium]NGZ26410.1 CopG family transcriptional regulator [Magnetococcales bacterium]
MLEAVPNEFELTEEQREGVLEAMQSVDAGHYVEHAEVMKWVQSWGTPNELPKPQCQ